MSQSASDICKKLQKLEGFAGINISQLIEITNKVYNNRVEVAEREDRKRMEKKAALLATTLGHPPPNRKGEKKREGPERYWRVDCDQRPIAKREAIGRRSAQTERKDLTSRRGIKWPHLSSVWPG